MSQIPFVNQLGQAIETAISPESMPSLSLRGLGRWRPRRRGLLPHRRASLLLAALVIGGGAVAVAETLQSSTALVTGGIVCYAGTGTGASVQMYANVEANGRTPGAACADVFRMDGPSALAQPGVRLTACADPHGFVAVFRSTGATNQCRRQGMSPLQSHSYALAQSRVDRLVAALDGLGASHACIASSTLVPDVQRVLDRLGWVGWRPELQARPAGSRGCAMFLGTGSSFSDPTASLDAAHRVVWISLGPIPALLTLTGPLDLSLLRASGRHCYSLAGARALVRRSLASARAEIRFALTQEPAGGGWAYAQRAYDRGCTIVGSVAPALRGRVIDAWLNSKGGAAEPGGWSPPSSAFR